MNKRAIAFTVTLVGILGLPMMLSAQTSLDTAREAESEARAISAAMMSWITDQVSRTANATRGTVENCRADVSGLPVIAHMDLESLLVPTYLPDLPVNDPWGHPYEFRLDTSNPLSDSVSAVRSAGADGVFEGSVYDFGTTDGPDGDLVLVDGFVARGVPKLDFVARQARVTEDLLSLGAAWLSWLTDNISRAGTPPPSPATVDLSVLEPVTYEDLVDMLVPSGVNFFYTRCVPRLDGWGGAYAFFMNANLLAANVLAIRSAGRDGIDEGLVYTVGTYPADDFARDTVWTDGFLAQGPDGPHRTIFGNGFESGGLWGNWSEVVDGF